MTKLTQQEIDEKWQKRWEENGTFTFKRDPNKPKFYSLDMFPYPSGELHCGHLRNYSLGDLMARWKRMQGYDVFLPFGFDAFGLPAENAAIERGADPKKWTYQNIDAITKGIKRMGYSCSWKNQVVTCSPEYYRWNQYIFLKFLEHGLAYKKASPINWCPQCNTVLANEQVEDGKCERCKTKVEMRRLNQWYFNITAFADELYEALDTLEEWPETVRQMQRNWIGKSHGTHIKFGLESTSSELPEQVEVFTTRPDTLYGVTFFALPPESEYVDQLLSDLDETKREEIAKQVEVLREEQLKDKFDEKDKKGIFLNHYVIHPLTQEKIPIYVANYVLAEYGTGFVMGVPAHDKRDHEFAKAYDIQITPVIKPDSEDAKTLYEGSGTLINSGDFNGCPNEDAKEKITARLQENGLGGHTEQFKLRDWCISRQRYWGTPIPVLYCESCGIVPELYENLPVTLPEDVTFTSEDNPIKSSPSFVTATCPKCGNQASRETDTMDTFVDSSWYFLRYTDSENSEQIFDSDKMKDLMQVDQYTGGVEHAVMHLLYARFFMRAMQYCGIFSAEWSEPFPRLLNQGMVLNEGVKMSKSKGNGIDPLAIIDAYGADTTRMFILSAAAPQSELDWTDKGVKGSYEIIQNLIAYAEERLEETQKDDFKERYFISAINRLITQVDTLFSEYKFNLALVELRLFFEELEKFNAHVSPDTRKMVFATLLKLLTPYIPHTCEELWEELGHEPFISRASWPKADETVIDEEAEKEHRILLELMGKINRLRQSKHLEQPQKILLVQASDQRYALFSKLDALLNETRDFKTIFEELKEDGRFDDDMKFIQKFLPKTLKDGLIMHIGKSGEDRLLGAIKDYLRDVYGCEVEIAGVHDVSERVQSIPGEPGVLLE